MKSFVLKTGPLGERDLLVTAVSRTRGKERLRAPGIRRHAAKLKGHVQPLSWSIIHTAAGRIQRIIVDAESLDDAGVFSPEIVRSLLFLADMIDAITIENVPAGIFFSYLERATKTVRSFETPHPMSAALFWGVRFLDEAGYGLVVSSCVACEVDLKEDVSWSALDKGFVCSRCANNKEDARGVSPEGMKVLRFLQRAGEEHASRLRLDDALGREVLLLLRDVARLLSGSLAV